MSKYWGKKYRTVLLWNNQRAFFKEFKVPSIIESEKYKGNINAVFLVTNTGEFKLLYINSPYKELKIEVNRVFNTFPKITPAKFNNNNVEMRFALPINFPLNNNNDPEEIVEIEKEENPPVVLKKRTKEINFCRASKSIK